ncbi:MAG: single-stranded-DNA-specific exonuclease RecJ [Oscillospiraceae bacterium]|nr:single-stranded-DNA-specific exonuclease RecJ [Oscillospiraceae bacterium]
MKWDVWHSITYDHQRGAETLADAVLWARGIDSPQEMEAFLSQEISRLHDPLLLQGVDQGVDRIRRAIAQEETVAVYGDYDVDGITASVLMVDYLRSKGLTCMVYIPDRLEEGYGLHPAALDSLAEAGVTLVVTVDCGATSVEEVAYAKTLGLDMIITDHHECQGALPEAVAVIDPKQPDCPYPEKDLAGVGVAFKFVCAIEGIEHTATLLERYSDLVAAGSVADLVELTGENRTLVGKGVEALRAGRRIGFVHLILRAGLARETLTATDIGYGLSPRINAAGRMGNPRLAFDLLCATDPDEASALAEALCTRNQQRQKVEQEIMEDALAMLEAEEYSGGPIILAGENWHKGVLGIVAARLMERHQEPVILLCLTEEAWSGSCRSPEGFNLFAALTACEDCLETFGGHLLAAGLTVMRSDLVQLKTAFGVYYKEHPPEREGRTLHTDFTLMGPDLLTLDQVKGLTILEPCGKGNPNPLLVLEDARLTKLQSIGGGKHVKLQVERWGRIYDGVFFSATVEELGLQEGDRVDIAFTPQCNTFRGRTTLQFLIRDMAKATRRRTGRAKRLYTQLLIGKTPQTGETQALCPDREDFIRLWRQLEAVKSDLTGRLDQVLDRLVPKGGCHAKTYLCLQVFHELGLASVREQADTVHIQRFEQTEKVDLMSSQVLRALQEPMEQLR